MQWHVHCNNKDNNAVDNNLGFHKMILLKSFPMFRKHWVIYFSEYPINARCSWGPRKGGRECVCTLWRWASPGPDKSLDFPWVTQNQKQTREQGPRFWVCSPLLRTQASSCSPNKSTKFMTWHYPATLGCPFPLQFYKILFRRRKKCMLGQ